MPAHASITVKKNDGTTDAIYVAKSPAAGDSSQAIWRYDAHAAPYAGFKPEFRMATKWNGPRTVRRAMVEAVYKAYITDSTTTASSVLASIPMSFTMALPQGIPQADLDEAISQFTNLLVSTLVRTSLKEGFAPS